MQLKLSGLTKKGMFRKKGIRKLTLPPGGMKPIKNIFHMRYKQRKAGLIK